MECKNCGKKTLIKKGFRSEPAYGTPWDEEGERLPFCSDDCMQEYFFGDHDFKYFHCDKCHRLVCEQNPRNGWHTQYRDLEHDHYERVCLECYEEIIVAEGIPKKSFEDQRLAGMFFNTGEVPEGYKIVPGFENYFIRSEESIKRYCFKAIELIDQGHKVVTGYESLGLGGGEGYVTMFAKGGE